MGCDCHQSMWLVSSSDSSGTALGVAANIIGDNRTCRDTRIGGVRSVLGYRTPPTAILRNLSSNAGQRYLISDLREYTTKKGASHHCVYKQLNVGVNR